MFFICDGGGVGEEGELPTRVYHPTPLPHQILLSDRKKKSFKD